MIYLDNSATTGKKPYMVKKAVLRELEESANPGRSSHFLGLQALNKIYETREELSRLFKINEPENFILTPNATYALNFAIKGLLKPFDHCITTTMEHNSVIRPLHSLKNVDTTFVKGDKFGYISPSQITEKIRHNTKLIIINHSSNVNGIIQDIKKTAELVKPYNIPILIDASQSAGIIDVNWSDFSLIAFAGHKSLYGPQGTGGLYVNPKLNLNTIIEGGTGSNSKEKTNPKDYPEKLESGTLNTPGFAGLTEGIKFVLEHGISNIREYEHYLLSHLLSALSDMNKITLYSPFNVELLSNLISFNIDGMDSTMVADILNREYNIAVRPGYHCAYMAHETLGSEKTGSVRVSVSYFNKLSEIKYLIDAINKISKRGC